MLRETGLPTDVESYQWSLEEHSDVIVRETERSLYAHDRLPKTTLDIRRTEKWFPAQNCGNSPKRFRFPDVKIYFSSIFPKILQNGAAFQNEFGADTDSFDVSISNLLLFLHTPSTFHLAFFFLGCGKRKVFRVWHFHGRL